jgi:FkbM family methyltransferase
MSDASTIRKIAVKIRRRWLRLVSRLKGPEFQYPIALFGYKVNLSLNEQIQLEIALGNFEADETGWVSDFLNSDMTFIDVGANMGYFSLLAASRVGAKGKVYAFEPSPYCLGKLDQSISDNGIKQIMVERCGLSDKPGQLNLVVEHSALHSPSFLAKDGDNNYMVPVVTLDSFLMGKGWPDIDLMKIDVEGFEPNVLRGAEGALKRRSVKAIFIELNDVWLSRNSSSGGALHELLLNHGFIAQKTKDYGFYKNVLYVLT